MLYGAFGLVAEGAAALPGDVVTFGTITSLDAPLTLCTGPSFVTGWRP